MSTSPISFPDALEKVREESLATSPVRGLFWMSMVVPKDLGSSGEIRTTRLREIVQELTDADTAGERHKPLSRADIKTLVAGLPEIMRVPGSNVAGGGPLDIYLETDVLQEKNFRNLGIGGGALKIDAIEVEAWTPLGLALNARHLDGNVDQPDPDWAYDRTREFMSILPMKWIYDELTQHGFDFKARQAPQSEEVARQSLHEPLGTWVPAYRDTQGRTHDAMDFLVERVASWGLERLTKIAVHLHAEDGAAMAGVQAARLHDIATDTYVPLRAKQMFDGNTLPIGETSAVHTAIGFMISEGATITKSQWGDDRRFGHTDASLETGALVSTVLAPYKAGSNLSLPKWDDEWRLSALQRLRSLGHDTVVAGKDAEPNERTYSNLPLYMAVVRDEPGCVAQLIEWGASEHANIHSIENDEGGTILEIAAKAEAEIPQLQSVIVLRAAIARRSAMDALNDIDTFVSPRP